MTLLCAPSPAQLMAQLPKELNVEQMLMEAMGVEVSVFRRRVMIADTGPCYARAICVFWLHRQGGSSCCTACLMKRFVVCIVRPFAGRETGHARQDQHRGGKQQQRRRSEAQVSRSQCPGLAELETHPCEPRFVEQRCPPQQPRRRGAVQPEAEEFHDGDVATCAGQSRVFCSGERREDVFLIMEPLIPRCLM